MTEFKSSLEAADFCLNSLTKSGTATLHLIKENAVREDGYLEFAFSSIADELANWTGATATIKTSGYTALTYTDLIAALADAGHSKASEILRMSHFVDMFKPGNKTYKKDDEFSFISISEKCAMLVFSSTDWNALSEYYSQYMNPTRH